MDLSSPRLGLSYLAPAQAQKHVTVNETFVRLDTLVQLSVISTSTAPQPETPAEGDAYILPAAATGPDWSQMQAGSVAAFQDGSWRELSPNEGWSAWAIDQGELLVFQSGNWAAITAGTQASNQAPIFGINTLADTTNRLSVKSDAVLLSHDEQTPGSGHMRAVINKSASDKTASVLFQDDFSGCAELGLLGNDDFSLRVSANGSSFQEALRVTADVPHVKTGASLGVHRTVPGDFWSSIGNNSALFMPYGYFGSNGSFGVGLWYNGYRNDQGGWTSQSLNGSNIGSGFELQASGCFVRFEAAPNSSTPAIRLRINEAEVSPGSDNSLSCGNASLRWAQVYAATGAINTSDARYKDIVGEISSAEKRAAKRIFSQIVKYRWKDSVSRKGPAARQHFGVTAQAVKAAFSAEGLDASGYGLWCEDQISQLDDHPETGVTERETGETRQGVRYEELLIFLMGALLS